MAEPKVSLDLQSVKWSDGVAAEDGAVDERETHRPSSETALGTILRRQSA